MNNNKNIKYRVFKISIGILFFHYYADSIVYKIKNRFDFIYPIFIYSFITFLFGLWTTNAFKSLRAIHINFTGGEDYTNQINQSEFDEITNSVWNNLSRDVSNRIDRATLSLMIDIQEKYLDRNVDAFSDRNTSLLLNELKRKGLSTISKEDILDFYDSLNLVFSKK